MANTFSPNSVNQGSIPDRLFSELPPGSTINVVGAGAFGGWSALYLQRKGYQVTLMDAWGPGNSRASSGGETRLIRCIYGDNAFYTRLASRSYRLWLENEALFGQQVLVPKGCLWFVGEDELPMMSSALSILDEEGLEYRMLNRAECETQYPLVDAEGLKHVVFEKKTGILFARNACRLVARQLVREGGNYETGWVSPDPINQMHTRADAHLFACGPWMGELFPDVFRDKLRVTRQEVYYFTVPSEFQKEVQRMPTWIDHGPPDHYYGIPHAQDRGFKIAFDRRGPKVDPTSMSREPTAHEVEQAKTYMNDRFPKLSHAALIESRVCQYTNTPTGSLFLDQHPDLPSVFLLGGGSGHGFKHGPALGELVADCIAGKRPVPGHLTLKHAG